jgi:hypothetical protein
MRNGIWPINVSGQDQVVGEAVAVGSCRAASWNAGVGRNVGRSDGCRWDGAGDSEREDT